MEHKKGVKPPASLNLYNGPSSFSLMNIAFCQVDRVDSIFQTYPHHSPEFLARTLEGHLHHGKDIFSLLAGRHLEVSIVMVVPLNIAGWFISTSQSKMDENWGYLHFGNPPIFATRLCPPPVISGFINRLDELGDFPPVDSLTRRFLRFPPIQLRESYLETVSIETRFVGIEERGLQSGAPKR